MTIGDDAMDAAQAEQETPEVLEPVQNDAPASADPADVVVATEESVENEISAVEEAAHEDIEASGEDTTSPAAEDAAPLQTDVTDEATKAGEEGGDVDGDDEAADVENGSAGGDNAAPATAEQDAHDAHNDHDGAATDEGIEHDGGHADDANDEEMGGQDEQEDDGNGRSDGDETDDDDVRHNDDEYDPANPSHDADEYDPAHPDPEHAQDEYDPANPAEGLTNGSQDGTTQSPPPLKRKLSDSISGAQSIASSVASPAASVSSSRSPKRARHEAGSKPDKRGLADSAWDRLMDFESTGEFRIAQVSRAAFSSISLLPEFAQCAIVARFERTPMKDIRDKNGLIMRLYHEYLGENPHVSSLQPVWTFVDDAMEDPGLFAFGYAPPMPTTGVSTVKIPFRRDKPGTITTPTAPSTQPLQLKPVTATGATTGQPQLDEFGREIKAKASPTKPERQPGLAQLQTPAAMQPTIAATPAAASGVRPSDPRRRPSGGPDATSRPPSASIEKSDVYNRLPASVKSRLDAFVNTRKLPETINDNVLSRLNHLSESAAIMAMQKFMEADLGQVGNLNGFLVGIINRVQDRPIDPRGPVAASRPAASAPGSYRPQQQQQQQQHAQHQPFQPHAQQHAPGPNPGYGGAAPPHDHRAAHTPMAHPHSLDHAGNHFRDAQMPPPQSHVPMAAPVAYDGRNPYPMDAPPAWNPVQGAPPPHQSQAGPTGSGRFSNHPTIDQAVAMLPVSVQNHLVSLVNSRILPSLDDLSEKCYEVLGQLSEGLANDVLKRFGTANLSSVRNRSGFLIGVIKKCRQEYGFD